MDIISTIVPILLLILAVGCLGYFSYILLFPLVKIGKEKNEISKINALIQKISAVDELLCQKKPILALKLLKSTVYHDIIYKEELLEIVKEHHQNILSRALIIAEELSTRADNISVVEHLFHEQIELQKLFLRAYQSHSSLTNRRVDSGKIVAQWTKDDFEKRLTEIKQELNKCNASLRKNLEELFKSLELNPNSNTITYH